MVQTSTHQYMTSARRRMPAEVLRDHLRMFLTGRVDEDVAANYADDAVVLSGAGVHRGHAGVRRAARMLHKSLPDARFTVRNQLVEGEYAFLEWSGHSGQTEIVDGADTFVIRDGRIVAHTSHYTLSACRVH